MQSPDINDPRSAKKKQNKRKTSQLQESGKLRPCRRVKS